MGDLRASTKFHITEHKFDFGNTLYQILAAFSTPKGGPQKKNVPVQKNGRVKIVAPVYERALNFTSQNIYLTLEIHYSKFWLLFQLLRVAHKKKMSPCKKWSGENSRAGLRASTKFHITE